MAGISDRLPTPLSERLASASQSIYSRAGKEVDIAIGGIPFRLATSQDLPQSVETIPVRKDQFDAEADPGEQSLTGWWRRSQASWHEGAGYLYQESNTSNAANLNFYTSRGIDVFTQGQLSLLKKMQVSARGSAGLSKIRNGTGGVLTAIGDDGNMWSSPDSDGTFTLFYDPGAFTLNDGFITGTQWYALRSGYGVFMGTVSPFSVDKQFPTSLTTSRMMWGKHRLWVLGLRSIEVVDVSAATGTPATQVFLHPNLGWLWRCMAEGPSAMYFAGDDGNTSNIMSVTLDSSGGVPSLTGAQQTAIFPDGEFVQEMAVIAGQYIGIGTNRGFRVGLINSSTGAIQYGPLMIEPAGVTACTAITTQGKFFVVAFNANNESIAYRIDTSNPLDGGVFPYAADIDLGISGYITSLAAYTNTRLVATGSTGEAYNQSLTDYVSTGYLQTGRIRYHTTEPKLFKYLNVEIAPLQGNIQIELINDSNTTVQVGSITLPNEIFTDKFAINTIDPLRFASLKFTLTPPGTPTATPVIYSYLMRALPSVQPQRLITLPLLCWDQETGHTGQRYGGLGYAMDRLTALQILENAADTLVFQDFSGANTTGQIVTIESLQYVQTSPPRPDRSNNSGGIIILKLRTAEA